MKKIGFLIGLCLLSSISCKVDGLHKVSDVHQLSIKTRGQQISQKMSKCTIHEIGMDSLFKFKASIKTRGGFSIQFDKTSYEIDLKSDLPLCNLPADDDWILNANYIDKTFIRHTFAYDLFKEMSPNNYAAQYRYVELFIDDIYEGLYVLMEKIDKSSLQLSKEDEEAVIWKEPHVFRKEKIYKVQDSLNPQQQIYPKIYSSDKSFMLDTLRTLVLDSSDKDFEFGMAQFFDLNNIIDWHLLLLISNNNDGIVKNFYLYKRDKTSPFRIVPWDYDHSLGRDGDNEKNLDRFLDLKRSILFDRLLEHQWYTRQLKAKWIAYNNQNLLSVNGLVARVNALEKIVKPLAERNFQKWPLDSKWYYDKNGFDQENELIKTFIAKRHSLLVDYFTNL